MRKLTIMASIILVSCQQVKKETITCKIKEVRNVSQSTLQDFEPRFVLITDCGYAATTKKRGLHVGDSVTFRVPVR